MSGTLLRRVRRRGIERLVSDCGRLIVPENREGLLERIVKARKGRRPDSLHKESLGAIILVGKKTKGYEGPKSVCTNFENQRRERGEHIPPWASRIDFMISSKPVRESGLSTLCAEQMSDSARLPLERVIANPRRSSGVSY